MPLKMFGGAFGATKWASGDPGEEKLYAGPVAPNSSLPTSTRATSGTALNRPAPRKDTKVSKFMVGGIQRFGLTKVNDYISDPFHTLLNLPWWKFVMVFFLVYLFQYCFFALLYLAHPSECILGLDGSYAHALWMSSRTASTIGFNDISPKPDCPTVNLTVMLQVISSSLIDFIMLGLVFARFSAPFKRASTIRMTGCMVANRNSAAGCWAISFRVANLRKHLILKPEIRMLLTAVDSITPSNYTFEFLPIEGVEMQQANLQLGFPANVVHLIKPGTPLYNLSLQEMEARMFELVVFVDGIDAMTSKHMQARKAYLPTDIRMNEEFVGMHLQVIRGKTGLDFKDFEATTGVTPDYLTDIRASSPQMVPGALGGNAGHLRHLTFKRLTEGTLTPEPAGAPAPAPVRSLSVGNGSTGKLQTVELSPVSGARVDVKGNPFDQNAGMGSASSGFSATSSAFASASSARTNPFP